MYNANINTIFLNSKTSKTSDPHILLLNLTDKINLKRSDMLLYQILAYTIMKKYKNVKKNNKSKHHLQYGMKNLN